ncbi:hypothetical protein SLEP1_g8202 [Rubroshorea leprosula]|uniref:Reverse transcriptase domain-containing protein n=1 Tax=Rubroshorea leprosula TaxID=152421 RepID=A0AAV5I984_9ROSI|nr:hypothetical protein SLEP1_g8202 [Rubroshorea leprosula]
MLWGSDKFEWAAQSASGASGGIVTIWNPCIFKKTNSFQGAGFLGVEGTWGEENIPCFLVNVYSPCDLANKRSLWENLSSIISSHKGNWCIAGDFNAIRSLQERKGGISVRREIREFSEFIKMNGLIDLPMIGRKFTWYQPNGHCMSRLDRFLFSEEWMLKWTDLKQWGLPRALSDHCPILVRDETRNWGPKPFKFYNVWLQDPAFRKMVEDQWNNSDIRGWGGFVLKEKLKRLKAGAKEWAQSQVQMVDNQIEKAKAILAELDIKGEAQQLNEQECLLKRDLMVLHEVNELKEGVANYFTNLFADDGWKRPVLDGVGFNQISEAEKDLLTEPFLESEVKAAVWNCDSAKAPGPDGFSFGFLKAEWEVIKEDILKFLNDFHNNSRMVRGSNPSFLVLIPKKENPQGIEEYRPISLIGCMYKILAKILANRLSKVMDGIISDQQSAFIGGRQLVDGVVIANETIDEIRRKRMRCFLFKADFEKAYDNISWEFLDYMLERMNFGPIWRGWIQECLRSNSISVLLNGSPTKEFAMQRGLRQGDPLAPFLFLIVAEGLNGIISSAVAKGLFEGVPIGGGGMNISHLQFADDTLLLGIATEDNVWTSKCIMRAFELVSGLKINYGKSSFIGINVDKVWEEEMTWLLNCKSGSLPCKYLGIPLGADPRRIVTWKPLIHSFKRKLSSWKGRYLSFGGRITLINSVLSSLPVFLMSFFLLPKSVIRELDKIRRRFLWGGVGERKKVAWVAWENTCLNKLEGGLGIKNLSCFNKSLLGKWWGRLLMEKGGLWKRVLAEKYGIKEGYWLTCLKEGRPQGSKWWRDVCKIDQGEGIMNNWVSLGFEAKLGDGGTLKFWSDVWVGGSALSIKFPHLFLLTTDQNATIKDMGTWRNSSWHWKLPWKRQLRSWEEDLEKELLEIINTTHPSQNKEDQWSWHLEISGNYTTKSAYSQLSKGVPRHEGDFKRVWKAPIPPKVSAFCWQLLHRKLPTKDNLASRGILTDIASSNCCWCDAFPESHDHIFLHCNLAYSLWIKCYKWWGVHYVMSNSCRMVLDQHKWTGGNKLIDRGWNIIWFAVVWTLWLGRNDWIFNKKEVKADCLLELVQIRSFYWAKNIAGMDGFSLQAWCENPSNCLKTTNKRKDRV